MSPLPIRNPCVKYFYFFRKVHIFYFLDKNWTFNIVFATISLDELCLVSALDAFCQYLWDLGYFHEQNKQVVLVTLCLIFYMSIELHEELQGSKCINVQDRNSSQKIVKRPKKLSFLFCSKLWKGCVFSTVLTLGVFWLLRNHDDDGLNYVVSEGPKLANNHEEPSEEDRSQVGKWEIIEQSNDQYSRHHQWHMMIKL